MKTAIINFGTFFFIWIGGSYCALHCYWISFGCAVLGSIFMAFATTKAVSK